MNIKTAIKLSFQEKNQLLALWNSEYPEQLAFTSNADFNNYLERLGEQSHLLLLDKNTIIMGWCFLFRRQAENWFAIIINSSVKGKGYGSKLVLKALEKRDRLNGWVIDHDNYYKTDGSTYRSPLAFYIHHGFGVIPEIRLETDQISAVKISYGH